jgi:hypothetical protein
MIRDVATPRLAARRTATPRLASHRTAPIQRPAPKRNPPCTT